MDPDFNDEPGNKKGTHIFQKLQYLRKLCNHPSFVLTKTHPQYTKITEKLLREKRSLMDIANAPKLIALQYIITNKTNIIRLWYWTNK